MASMEGSNGSPQRAASSSSNVEPAPEPATLEPPNEAKAPTNVPSEQGPEWADLVKPPLVPVARGRGQPDSPSNSNPDLAQFGMDSSTHMPLSSIREAPLGTADAPSEADGAEDTQSTAPLRPRAHPLEGVLSRDEIDGRAPPGEALPAYRQEEREPEEEDEDDAARSGLKLGLGDFVFYSVMVSRAAMRDWVTTICVSLSAIAGLVSTIFLLVLFRKALPALPISIAFGITFYFASTAIIVPWVLEGLYGGIPWNAGMVQGLRGTWQEGGQQSLYAGSWTGGVVYT